ncbi:E3 ubiquitin-protein ligase ptr1 [Phytophthora ramorum]|uniref:E3 ubiquitin-protein ligase ptr1 n=1 Tax=Phytophthora ramorum TaxID=164328 RepID=UPI0030A4D8A3|nr:E3 ubiquitin-protein ligase ptr1 [Phytophthora ramorum]
MGGVLRKAPPSSASAVATKGVFASSSPTNSRVVVPVPSDEQLELEDELQAKREEEAAQKQKAAVAHVVENLFAYAPVTVQTQKYPSSSSKAGQAYLWITVDEAEIKRRGGGASPVRYPVGVAVDINGNVFVSEAGGTPKANANDSQAPYKISADSIMDFAASKRAPPVLKPPRLVEALQIELVVKWKKSTDSTVDRYEVQYRRADSLNNSWAGLAVVTAWKHVSLSGIKCHTPFEFRVRARNPGGWSEYSDQSEVFWTLPGPPDLPRMPIAGAVSNTYASVFWFPVEANGAPPVIYSLEVRESGGGQQSSFLQVYEGTGTGFVVGRLSPKTTYTFRLQASNVVGATAFVESKSVKTMAYGKPEIVELTSAEKTAAYDRWVQCWDPKTEQVFYFNKFTSQRVTEEPPELAVMREERGVITVEETPEMLFRRKRFRFHRELRKSMQGLNFGNTMKIELQRESMFEGTLKYFQPLTKADLVAKPKISFENEPGIDSGGLSKDWFLQVSKLATHKSRRLFKICDEGLFAVELTSSQLPNFAQQYKFLGKFIAKAIFDRQTLDLPFCDAVYKRLLQQSTGIEDLHQMDSQYHKSLVWMLENDIADVIDETFSVEMEAAEAGKKPVVVDLKENGKDIPVTDVNKQEYVDLVVQWRTQFGAQAQMDALVQGFTTLVPLSAIKVFNLIELKMLVNGKPTIDVEELRSCTVFQGGYDEHAQVVLWLWQALRAFTTELRGMFLKFMTGTNKIPLDGFEPPLNLTKSDLDPQALPRTHTCFNQLVLPEYTSYETLVEKVTFAITNADGFELS